MRPAARPAGPWTPAGGAAHESGVEVSPFVPRKGFSIGAPGGPQLGASTRPVADRRGASRRCRLGLPAAGQNAARTSDCGAEPRANFRPRGRAPGEPTARELSFACARRPTPRACLLPRCPARVDFRAAEHAAGPRFHPQAMWRRLAPDLDMGSGWSPHKSALRCQHYGPPVPRVRAIGRPTDRAWRRLGRLAGNRASSTAGRVRRPRRATAGGTRRMPGKGGRSRSPQAITREGCQSLRRTAGIWCGCAAGFAGDQ